MTDATYRGVLVKQIRGNYGQWTLVHLISGRWAAVWAACFDLENMCEMILTEDPEWFNEEPLFEGHAANPSYATREEALKKIIEEIEDSTLQSPLMADVFEPDLKRARIDLICHSNSEPTRSRA